MQIDWTLNVGQVLSFAMFIGGGIGIFVRQEKLLNVLAQELKALRHLVEYMDQNGSAYAQRMAVRVAENAQTRRP